jgi:hypothetical protein
MTTSPGRRHLIGASTFLGALPWAALCATGVVQAQAYPDKPI